MYTTNNSQNVTNSIKWYLTNGYKIHYSFVDTDVHDEDGDYKEVAKFVLYGNYNDEEFNTLFSHLNEYNKFEILTTSPDVFEVPEIYEVRISVYGERADDMPDELFNFLCKEYVRIYKLAEKESGFKGDKVLRGTYWNDLEKIRNVMNNYFKYLDSVYKIHNRKSDKEQMYFNYSGTWFREYYVMKDGSIDSALLLRDAMNR
jgi:hypothetical protein